MARCDGCGRPMCLGCAVPVRGRVLGTECLAEAIGSDAPQAGPAPEPRRDLRATLIGAAFAVAVFATALPWSRFGEGSGPFGAWGRSRKWSVVAAVAALLGLAAWAWLRRLPPGRRSAWDVALVWLAALTSLGALLAIVNPPPFTHAWLGPWLALAAGLVALAASLPSRSAGRGLKTEGS